MSETLQRELIYLWYYFDLQLRQILPYWFMGMALGSIISVFGKERINHIFVNMQGKKLGLFGLVPACILGMLSPLCMYGTIPIAAAFAQKGMREDWLAAFMMSSILLNPQLIIYSAALGPAALAIRISFCFLCGMTAGLLVYYATKAKAFFDFAGFAEPENRDIDPNPLMRLLKSFGRNIKATGLYFLLGILLAAIFQRYVPAQAVAELFGKQQGFGVLMAATLGVPLYVCGGGTIPLLQQWMDSGMSMGSAAAFMITGPATKITNMSAVKIVLGIKKFIIYIVFVILFALVVGLAVNLLAK